MIDYEQLGRFYLGRAFAPDVPAADRAPILYDARDLTTHAVCVGMTGSGKTGLCLGLVEEAAIDGIPTIAIDPKGDLGNLALTFPSLRPEEFRPWMDEGEAARRGMSTETLAAETAARWREGLASWGQSPERVRRLREAAEVRIYTPGSDAGLPLAVLGSFEPPSGADAADGGATTERIGSLVSGLLALIDVDADPMRREHVLLSTLISDQWAKGCAVGLGELVGLVQRPPLAQIGVAHVDTFFPAPDRAALAMRLNALLAAPGAATWLQGEPLDAGRLLFDSAGRPRISVISIAHLDDRERMFVVTLVLGAVLAWMRRQPGSSSLRAMLYMDEVFGFLPPVANPPSKAPLLTMLKQARAYGLGVVLATQNPVDLDYKALGNAGTWLIGRLQTARDRDRLMDGLIGAGGAGAGLDRQVVMSMLSGLESRVFLLHDVHEDAPVLLESRWVLSYLRGPFTPTEIRRLMDPLRGAAPAAGAVKQPGVASPAPPADVVVPATLEAGVESVILAPGEGAVPTRYVPALLVTVRLHFVRASAGLDAWRTERVLIPFNESGEPDWEAGRASAAPEVAEPLSSCVMMTPPVAAMRAATHRAWAGDAVDAFYRSAREVVWTCGDPKAVSRAGESEAEFRARLAALAREARDEGIERLGARFAPKLARQRDRILEAEARVRREAGQYEHHRTQTMISVGTSVLGALFGRKLASATTIGRAGTAARSASRAAREHGDIAAAEAEVEAEREALRALERAFEDAVSDVRAPIDATTFRLQALEVSPRKKDVTVERLALAWVPT